MNNSITDLLQRSTDGSQVHREQIIEQYRPFIIRTVSHICKRSIGWNDDEASIGLIAFNESIDRYNPNQDKSFDNYAYMIIQSRLIDEFRKNGKLSNNESLMWENHDEFESAAHEISSSLEVYERERSATDLAHELLTYDEVLQEYGILLEELESCSPSHRDTREQLIEIAKHFHKQPSLMAYLKRTKHLPIKEMMQYAGVSKKTLERNRKYLIALILIFSSEEFIHIRSAVSFIGTGE
ncbi:RNA polymerase sigma-I factor [Paenibacillus sp. N1-5-1-14]|uniref:RNA polymerase sigma-I factor n=1 Tax=Paenibacillus radicibacter TaxID=2972488 RepID=UPI0021599A18|nr:RNA polymerase sigma-I factor [Paenibacillus radicibacter]MCR8645600.1 RNA polymerase sigma-I factor [Paenibacillus radicibacter]